MEKISLKKKLLIIRLYIEGLSYSEIAAKANVSKGTVANVIAELKSGRFPEFGDLYEQLELIRELAVDLKRTRLTPVQAAVGISVLSRLRELEVEPGEIEGLSALFRTLNAEGTDMQSFIRVALSLEEARKRTGLSVEELEVKVHGLEESASRLEPLVKEVKQTESALKGQERNRKSLVEEVVVLEKRDEILKENVRDKEQRETELSNRVRDLEDRAQSADEQLTNTRKDLQTLSGIGMSPDNLSAFAQRLKVVAQHHGMKPEIVCSKLMNALEQLDEGLGLDIIVEKKNQKLRKIEGTILRAEEKSVVLASTNEKLQQERSNLEATLSEERKHIIKDIKAIKTAARNTISKLKQDLAAGVRESVIEVSNLKNQIDPNKKDLILLDNNVLASAEFPRIVEDIKRHGFRKGARLGNAQRYVDFNQGVDARLLKEEKMELLSQLPLKPLRIAFDSIKFEKLYIDKIRLAHKYGIRHLSNFILFNYDDTLEDFYRRLQINIELNEELGLSIFSFPMRYIPLDAKDRKHIGPNWTKTQLRGIQCILHATHGVVGPRRPFFEKAFGKDAGEFKYIIEQPGELIFHRENMKLYVTYLRTL